MIKKSLILIAILLVPLAYAVGYQSPNVATAEGFPTAKVVLISPAGKEVVVLVEIAANYDQRKLGLMNRSSMAKRTGMLFLWKKKKIRKLWMKNTFIPLDMIFINDQAILGFVNNASPHSLTPRTVGAKGNAVLEVNAGFVAKHQITAEWKIMYNVNGVIVE